MTNRDFKNAQDVKVELPSGAVFNKTATVRTISSSTWNTEKESELNMTTNTITDFDNNKTITVPKFGMVILNFTGSLNLVTALEEKVDNMEKLQVRIYPNPSQRIIHIEGPVNPFTRVYNSVGTEVMTSYSNTLDFSGLSKGIYNLVIQSNNSLAKEKIVLVD